MGFPWKNQTPAVEQSEQTEHYLIGLSVPIDFWWIYMIRSDRALIQKEFDLVEPQFWFREG